MQKSKFMFLFLLTACQSLLVSTPVMAMATNSSSDLSEAKPILFLQDVKGQTAKDIVESLVKIGVRPNIEGQYFVEGLTSQVSGRHRSLSFSYQAQNFTECQEVKLTAADSEAKKLGELLFSVASKLELNQNLYTFSMPRLSCVVESQEVSCTAEVGYYQSYFKTSLCNK